jgi:hypothetical protein
MISRREFMQTVPLGGLFHAALGTPWELVRAADASVSNETILRKPAATIAAAFAP